MTARKTSPYLQKHEEAALIGRRAEQIEKGASPMVDYTFGEPPLKIAMRELKERKMPLQIDRILPDGSKETWAASELIYFYGN
jgi:DNA-directed RNA polymerases I, II, and III subunit RPABC2